MAQRYWFAKCAAQCAALSIDTSRSRLFGKSPGDKSDPPKYASSPIAFPDPGQARPGGRGGFRYGPGTPSWSFDGGGGAEDGFEPGDVELRFAVVGVDAVDLLLDVGQLRVCMLANRCAIDPGPAFVIDRAEVQKDALVFPATGQFERAPVPHGVDEDGSRTRRILPGKRRTPRIESVRQKPRTETTLLRPHNRSFAGAPF